MNDNIEYLSEGLSREIVQAIVIFTLSNMEIDTVNLWIDACREVMETCQQQQQPLLILQDLSNPNAQQTGFSKIRGQELTTAYPDLMGRIAFVVQDSPETQATKRFVEAQPKQARERKIFFSREEALTWLKNYTG